MRRGCLLAVLGAALGGPAGAHAAVCPQDPQRPADTWYVTDATTHQELTPAQIAGALAPLHSYRVSLSPGSSSSGSVQVSELVLTPPAGAAFTREGHAVIVSAQSPGPLTISGSWSERDGVDPDCTRSATLTLNIAALSERPNLRFTRHIYSDRPLVDFTITVARGPLGVPDPVVVRAKVGGKASPPTGQHAVLFTLPLGLPPSGPAPPASGLLARRSAKLGGVRASGLSAFESNAYQVPVPAGGSGARITFAFDGTGRKVRNRFGSFYRQGVLARRGLDVEILQDGDLLGRLSTGILCVAPRNTGFPRCRLPGYRTSTR